MYARSEKLGAGGLCQRQSNHVVFPAMADPLERRKQRDDRLDEQESRKGQLLATIRSRMKVLKKSRDHDTGSRVVSDGAFN